MPSETSTRVPVPWFLWLLALAARLFAWRQWCGGMVWPDEIFQSLEPAHHLAFGQAALSWEWIAGSRSWLAPLFYAIPFRVQAAFGLDGPGQLLWGARLGSVLVSLLIVKAAWRLGDLGGGSTGAWLSGIAAALSPSLLFDAPRTLNDGPSAAFIALCLTLLAELPTDERPAQTAVFAGLLAGLAYIFRATAAIFVLVPVLYLLLSHRRRHAFVFLGCLGAVVMATGLLDWPTWGTPFHSTWHYVKFNLVDGMAAQVFGSDPQEYYAGILHRDLGILAFATIGAAVLGAMGLWTTGLSLLLGLILMSWTCL